MSTNISRLPEVRIVSEVIKMYQGRWEEAAAGMERVLSTKSGYPFKLLLYSTLMNAGRVQEARRVLASAQRLLKENRNVKTPVLGWMGDWLIGSVELQLPLYEMIEKECVKDGPPPFRTEQAKQDIGKLNVLGIQLMQLAEAMQLQRFTAYSSFIYDVAMGKGEGFLGRFQPVSLLGTARINAARAAAQASSGQGRDAHQLPDADRTRFRKLAIGWLRSQVDADRRTLEGKEVLSQLPKLTGTYAPKYTVNHHLSMMLVNREFSSIRDPESIRSLPEDDRREAERLWADVRELQRISAPPLNLPPFQKPAPIAALNP